jgi:hypothetical protein
VLGVLIRTARHEDRVPVAAVVDSGADETLLPLQLAVELGLESDLETAGSAAGVASTFATWRCRLAIRAQVLRYGLRGPEVAWGPELLLRPVFAEPQVALLGRADFFPHFRITFETDPIGPIFHLDSG